LCSLTAWTSRIAASPRLTMASRRNTEPSPSWRQHRDRPPKVRPPCHYRGYDASPVRLGFTTPHWTTLKESTKNVMKAALWNIAGLRNDPKEAEKHPLRPAPRRPWSYHGTGARVP